MIRNTVRVHHIGCDVKQVGGGVVVNGEVDEVVVVDGVLQHNPT